MRTLGFLLLALLACVSYAAQPRLAEYSLGIGGELVIDPQGRVHNWNMDDGLAPVLADLVQRNVERWTFEPIVIEGQPVAAKTRMRLMLLARPRDNGDYELRVDEVWFGDMKSRGEKAPPRYPRGAIQAGIEARVVVLARVDAQGNVIDVHPYQTSLSKKGSVARWRKAFEEATLAAVRQWKYEPGEEIGGARSGNTLKIPMTFELASGRSRQELAADMKRWRSYLPGPISPAPWLDDHAVAAIDDAEPADGEALSLQSRFRLKDDVIGRTL